MLPLMGAWSDLARLEVVSQCSIRATGTYMTVKEPFVYVTTAADSLCVFRLEDGRLTPHCRYTVIHSSPADA